MGSDSRNNTLRHVHLALLCAAAACIGGCGGGGADPPPQAYTVGGMVMGLTAGAHLTLLDNGSDSLQVAASGRFTFPTPLPSASGYAVTIAAAPQGQTCSVAGGTGTIRGTNVASVQVMCSVSAYTVGGSISGLTSSGLVLADGNDRLAVVANAVAFTLPSTFASGSSYEVTVSAHPPARSCSVTDGSGVVATANVSGVTVSCVPGTESVLHAFPAASGDGATPEGKLLLDAGGTLYGLTYAGGSNALGAVFKIAPDGTETVLYSFAGGSDGANPHGSLIQARDGNFYGVTVAGGDFGHGVIFMLTPAGAETVLHAFGSGAGAQDPYGALLQASDGNFYGMSVHGGAYGLGAVYLIRPDGSELVIHSFGNGADGQSPYGSLMQASDGNLYGMTSGGGAYGGGIAFSMTLLGSETVLHSFGSGSDGAAPNGSLIQAQDGNLYGLTSAGGANGMGAAIRLSTSGAESVLASFGAGNDGAAPSGDLLQGSDGNLYALASSGGANGAGAVLQLSPGGVESVLYSFAGGSDGQQPWGSLIEGPDATLYGATSGGRAGAGGTVFQIN